MVEFKAEISVPGAEVLKEIAGGGRGALRRVFGSALISFGDMLDDQMKLWRFTNLLRIKKKVDILVKAQDVPETLLKALPFGDGMRTLDAASLEDDEAVQDLWACLVFKAAISEKPSINKTHIELLRSLTATDSSLLELLYPSITGRSFTAAQLTLFNSDMNKKAEARWRRYEADEQDVSIQNLIRLRMITATPRLFDAGQLLTQFADRERRISGALVDPKKFEDVLSRLVTLIYQSAGALPYETSSPVPLHFRSSFGAPASFGAITVPELNYTLTPLGVGLMKSVTLDRTDE